VRPGPGPSIPPARSRPRRLSRTTSSALLAGLASGLVAWNRSYIDPPSMFDSTIDLQTVVFVLFGGMGTV
jgi:ABC-type branched-subunit amino acid transport system permease subunit